MTRILLLGGPTGVGKSSALRLLDGRLPKSALLDADDVWRISEDLAIEGTRRVALDNVISVMQGYLEAGCELGILAWVFARPQLYEPVIEGLKEHVDAIDQLYLVASPESIRQRLVQRGEEDRFEYALSRLELIEQLPFARIDTTGLEPEQVADQIVAHLGYHGPPA